MVPVPPAEEGNVSVVVRVRPPVSREGSRQSVVQVVSDCMLVFDPEEASQPGISAGFHGHDSAPRRKGKEQKFAFDRVFGESATQVEVFENTTKDILDGFLNGYNCSEIALSNYLVIDLPWIHWIYDSDFPVFAYGATGAGKTHTMLGSEEDPGIMYLTMAELYKKIEARKGQKDCEVLISYQEVYNEQIHDLLQPKGPLAVREDPEKGVVVPGLSFHQPKTAEQLLEMLARGNRNRTQHPTDLNATSSRSHAIFQVSVALDSAQQRAKEALLLHLRTARFGLSWPFFEEVRKIYVKQHDGVAGVPRNLQVAKMSLIDLAGSERASVTNTRGERLREGANINRSLLALINVINALADAKSKKPHIPYRDSKLTRLLKDSIGGNCRTVMIAAVNPSALSYEDTYNTLKYANRAKEIKLLMKSNVLTTDCPISQHVAVCERLKAEVVDLQRRLQAYEGKGLPVNPQVPAHSRPEQAEILSVKDVGSGRTCDREVEVDLEQLKPNWGTSSLGESSLTGKREPEEKPGGSRTESSNPVERWEKVALRPQKMERVQLERLVKAILSIAQKQYAVLKAANLLTPDITTEFEQLDGLVPHEAREMPEPLATENPLEVPPVAPEVVPPLKVPQLVDNAGLLAAFFPAAEHASSGSPTAPGEIPPPPPGDAFRTPHLPAKRRRRSAGSATPSGRNPPSVQKGRAKRRRKAGPPAQPVDSPEGWAVPARTDCTTSTPFAERTRSSPADPPAPQPCPLTVTKGRAPLAPSAAQNGSTPLPLRGLNATFDLGKKNPCPATAPEFPAWESIQPFPHPQAVPLIPRASMPVFTMKGASISRSASLASRTSTRKGRHAAGAAPHARSVPRSRIARLQGSSLKPSQAVNASGPPTCGLAWKWR